MAYEPEDEIYVAQLEDHDFTHDPATDPIEGCYWCDEYLAEQEEAAEAA